MKSFRLSRKAINDFKKIGRYTEKKWGRTQRNLYLSKLDTGFSTIVSEPLIGKNCDYISVGYRKYHVGRHLIFYRQSSSHIEIIRILHDSMDVDNTL